jgi:peptide/nickel transport system substrate-binding protein
VGGRHLTGPIAAERKIGFTAPSSGHREGKMNALVTCCGKTRRGIRPFAALLGLAAALALAALADGAAADGDQIRKLVLLSGAQAADPQEFQAAQLIAQEWRKLGLEVEVRGLPRPQVSDIVWYNRDKWDVTMWRMVGRPERSDPDELVYNLFHSSTREKGFNFVGYANPEYDRIAEAQRSEIDAAKRRALVHSAQDIVMADVPYLFLVYPKNVVAFNAEVWKKETVVEQSGIGVRNFWTFIGAAPAGAQQDMILNSAEALNAVNPLYISGAIDSWVTDLVWDRLMRVGPDGLPKPWAAESVTYLDDKTVEAKLRSGMTWHDGRPLTIDDVMFSFAAPAGDKSPMYKPFVADIAAMEQVDGRTIRFKLKTPNASFFTSTLAKINLIPKHVWEPILSGPQLQGKTAESYQEPQPVGSGPFKVVRFKLQEEVLLERNGAHFSPPKMQRWILRIVTNTEAALGMLRRGEVNFLADYRGDPKILEELSKTDKALEVAATVDMGFRFVAPNLRRPPFDDARFRAALMLAINRNLMAEAAWNGYAVPANSHISSALPFWHKGGQFTPSVAAARKMLEEAGYKLVGGKLHYPDGKREALTSLN